MKIDLYSDGSCSRNPGPAGWAFIGIIDGDESNVYEQYGPTTNQVGMVTSCTSILSEMTGAFEAIKWAAKQIKGKNGEDIVITLIADCAYVLNCLNNRWYNTWRLKAKDDVWHTVSNGPVSNQWLWEKIIAYVERLMKYKVTFVYTHIKGHNGHKWNERADTLAKMGTDLSKKWDPSSPFIGKYTTNNYLELT